MINKKRLLAFATSIIGLALVASITSSVAWYNGASFLAVNNFVIRLKDEKLSISNDNERFVDFLSDKELNAVDKFRSVSSMFSNIWLDNQSETPIFRGNYSINNKTAVIDVSDSKVANNGYFSQALYLKCNDDATITLDTIKTTFRAAEEENEKVAEKLLDKYPMFTKEEILFNLNNVVKSLRLSILVLNDTGDNNFPDYRYYIIDPYKEGPTYYGGILDNDLDGYFDYYQDKEIFYGQLEDGVDPNENIVYQSPLGENISFTGGNTCFNSGHKKGVRPIDLEASISNGLAIVEEQSVALKDAEDIVEIPLKANISKRIVLSFYQEGWDKDNTNFVMYSHFFVNVLFKIKKMGFERE